MPLPNDPAPIDGVGNEPSGDEVTSVTISPKTNNLSETGVIRQLTVVVEPSTANQNVTWSSDDSSIVKVDENGLVMSIKPGTTTIRATATNGVEGTATVNVAGV